MGLAKLGCLHCGVELFPNQENFCCVGCSEVYTLLRNPPEDWRFAISSEKYQYLDNPEYKKHLEIENENHFQFYIEGIHCTSCIQALEKIPQFIDGVKHAELNYFENILDLTLEKNGSLASVAELIQQMGYQPYPLKKNQNVQLQYKNENRKDLIRIAVSAAIAGNIMLLSISEYAGLNGELLTSFHVLQGLIYLPLLLYVALPFYSGALRALRFAQISIDLPITVALLVSSLFSYFSLFTGGKLLYFDSTATFISLILASRYLLKRLQQNTIKKSMFLDFIKQSTVHVKSSTAIQITPIDLLKENDIIILNSGENIPVDGVLLSNFAEVDFSVISGESASKRLAKGMRVLAGCKVYSDNVEIKAELVREHTKIGQMLSSVEKKIKLTNQADKISQILIAFVLLLSLGFFIFYYPRNPQEAFARALALIVVACPCALALGAPLAIAQGLRKALSMGILIKSTDVLNKAEFVKNIAFDKTGTLTTGKLKLNPSVQIDDNLKSIMLGLEEKSQHPIAFSIRNLWKNCDVSKMEVVKETPGVGVEGVFKGELYKLQKEIDNNLSTGTNVGLYKNKQKILTLNFSDELKPDAKSTIHELRKNNLNVFLLSGDNSLPVQNISDKLSLSKEQCFANMSPKEKMQWFEKHPNSVMVGDGGNDILSFAKSSFSIAVNGSMLETLQTADVYLFNNPLKNIINLFEIAKQTRLIIKRNIFFALIYNVFAGTAALMGLINPLVAAVLMPLSSLLIITSSFFGTKRMRALL